MATQQKSVHLYLSMLSRVVLACGVLGVAAGCTPTQVSTVVKDIGVYAQQAEPIIIALMPIITALSSNLGDAQTSASLNSFAEVAKADVSALESLCNDYATSPDASVYGRIESTIDKLVGESDTALLQVLAIKDPDTRQRVQLALAGFDAIIHTIDGFVQTTETASAVAAKAQARGIKLRQVASAWSVQDRGAIARAFGTSYESLLSRESLLGF